MELMSRGTSVIVGPSPAARPTGQRGRL